MSPEYNFIVRADLRGETEVASMQQSLSALKGVQQVEMLTISPASRFDSVEVNGDLIRKVRKDAKLTQLSIAKHLGISRGYISVIESREGVKVSKGTAKNIANLLGMNLTDLEKA